ncbi:hypothetical protein [Sphaerisporangium aureirubrum]|uniref:Uncharacterized protein n=1 Tax=Sphaerisporangium aureirubrum TaxID=1544736 RepID=A0ABW1NVR3_9ACTN
MTDPATGAIVIALIGAVMTGVRTWLRHGRGLTHELRTGRVYRLPPGSRIHHFGRRWVAVEAEGRPAGRRGRPDDGR